MTYALTVRLPSLRPNQDASVATIAFGRPATLGLIGQVLDDLDLSPATRNIPAGGGEEVERMELSEATVARVVLLAALRLIDDEGELMDGTREALGEALESVTKYRRYAEQREQARERANDRVKAGG